MKLAGHRFLEGPNRYAPGTGILARVTVSDSAVFAWRPPADALAVALQIVRQGFAPSAGETMLGSAETVAAADIPFFALLFTAFDYLTQEWAIDRRLGHVHARAGADVDLFLPCAELAIGSQALGLALPICMVIAAQGAKPGPLPAVLAERFGQFQALAKGAGLDAATVALLREAQARGIPWRRLAPASPFVQLGQGTRLRRIAGGDAAPGRVAARLADDGLALNALLRRLRQPAPQMAASSDPAQITQMAARMEYPVEVGPRLGEGGMTVATDEASLIAALKALGSLPGGYLIAKPGPGQDYEIEVGPNGAQADVHPDNLRLAERIVRVVGLEEADVVYRTEDPGISWRDQPGQVTALRGPWPGPPITGRPDLATLFPAGADGRIPTVGVTGSIGKSTTCNMVSAVLTRMGLTVGHSTTQGAWVGGEKIAVGDVAGGRMAGGLLSDPAVEAGVFELSRGGLIKRGMGIDAIDAGAVLCVHDNHLGLNEISTREELAAVKSVVARHARKLAVLNADDELVVKMRDQSRAERIALVTLAAENPVVEAHRAAGGLAGVLYRPEGRDAESELRLFDGKELIGAIGAPELPASMQGRFFPPMISGLYAALLCHGLGVDFETIRTGLGAFENNFESNPWRMNQIEGLPFGLWITWADGAPAYAALCNLVAKTETKGRKTFMFSMMGDRQDPFMIAAAQAVATADAFDDYIVSDAVYLRGRPQGEVAGLLARTLIEAGIAQDRVTIAEDHLQSSELALSRARPDDLVVMVTPRVGGERIVREVDRMRGELTSG